MSNTVVEMADLEIGPLEQKHLRDANFRAVANGMEVTKTHWHIALANGLGWGFDGMASSMFSLVSPLIIAEFALDVPTYRSGLQIALLVGIIGLYFWPWLADRYGRRTLLALNIALFSFMMPLVALAPTFALFIAGLSVVNFALNGEWALGSMLVTETWPARLRGRVISINRATWCFGVALAGGITGIVATTWGWRVAVMVPGVIALLAIYVRATCPESPYWVRAQDRKRRIAEALSAGGALNEDDQAWYAKVGRVSIRQVFMPDVLPATLVALFVACSSCCIFGTVGSWMPYYLSVEKHWSTQEYSAFYVCWGIVGFFGLCLAGWLADRIGRRVGFIAMLIEGAIFITLWVFTDSHHRVRSSRRGCILFANSRLHAYRSSRGPSEWCALFEAAMATADTQAELDQWRRLNVRAIDLLHKQAPSEHSAVMTEIAAAAERVRRGGARREPGEDIDGGYRAAAEWR